MKVEALNIIVKESWSLKIKKKYNDWISVYISKNLEANFSSNNLKKKWINLHATAFHNTGFIFSEYGSHAKVLNYYQKSYDIRMNGIGCIELVIQPI